MRLRRFTVEGFAQLDHVDVAFRDEAPNIIFGLNEAGKSHLMQAFCGMFFPIEHPDELVPWQGKPVMHGALEFVDADGHLVRLERDYQTANVEVNVAGHEAWTGKVKGTTTDALRFAECLQKWLGFRDQGLFTATTFVRQADVIMQDHGSDRRGLATQVKALITGTQETSYERVLKDLQKELDSLRMPPGARKPRDIEDKRAELETLRTGRMAAERDHGRYSTLEHERGQLGRDITRDQNERDTIDQRLQDAGTLIDRERELTKLNTDFGTIDRNRRQWSDLQRELTVARERRASLAPFAAIDEIGLTTLQRDVDEAKREITRLSQGGILDPVTVSRLETAVQDARRALQQLPPWPADCPIELIREAERDTHAPSQTSSKPATKQQTQWLIAAGLAALGVVLSLVVSPIFLVLVAGAALYAAASHRGKGVRGAVDLQTDQQPSEVRLSGFLARVGVATASEAEGRWQARQEATSRVAMAEEELRTILTSHGVATVEQAKTRTRQCHNAEETLNQAQRQYDVLLSSLGVAALAEARIGFTSLREVQQHMDTLQGAIGMLGTKEHLDAEWARVGSEHASMRFEVDHLLDRDQELKALGTPDMRALYIGRLRQRAEELHLQIEKSQERERVVRLEQADLGSTSLQDVPVLDTQIQELEQQIARMERKARALDIATTELGAAVAHFRDNCLGEVMEDTSNFLETVTDGRYSRVEVQSDDLIPIVITADRSIPVHQLSRGVQDQLYFALRVALARAITCGRTLPLVLDDPFVNFDPIRRERVLTLLRGLVDRTQIILFTCDPWYGECITPIYELESIEKAGRANAIVDVA